MVAFFIPPPPSPLPATSMAFQTSATSAASDITCPTVQLYDVAVLFDWAYNNTASPVAEVYPSGFTPLISQTETFFVIYRGCISYKLLTGAESGTSLVGMSSDGAVAKTLLIFRPNGVVQTGTSSAWLGEITSGNPSGQLIGASGQAAPLIRLAYAAINTSGTPDFSAGTFDATVTNVLASNVHSRAGYTIQNSSPADDTVDMIDYGGNWLASGYLRFS